MPVASPDKPSFWQRIRPKAVRFSFAGAVFSLFTGTMFVLTAHFHRHYPRLILWSVVFLVLNTLFFVRFRDKRKKSLMERLMASRFFPRKLALTNEGRFLVIISLGMGFAAVNTGSNLLYLLLAMLLSIITASGILSELSLRKVRWETAFPDRAVSGQETLFPIRVTNRKRAFSSFSLEGALQFHDDPEGIRQSRPAIIKLRPGHTDALFPAITFPRRGLYRVSAFSIGTRYPFSFFTKSRVFKAEQEILAVPRGDNNVEEVFFAVATGFEEHANRVGRGSEFFSVRPMQSGDEWRDVHWKQSARTGTFTVKEYEALTARRITVRLSRRVDTPLTRENGEAAIEIAASVIKRLALAGYDVGLRTANSQTAPAAGPHAVRNLFTRLALVDLGDEADVGLLPPALAGGRDVFIDVDLDDRSIAITGMPGGPRQLAVGGTA